MQRFQPNLKKPILILLTVTIFIACSESPTGRNQMTLIPDGRMAALGESSTPHPPHESRVEKLSEEVDYYDKLYREALAEGRNPQCG